MSAADCLRLRHRGRGRRRYSLRLEEPIDWSALADTLRVRLTGTPFRFRLNPIAQSVVISGITAGNDQAWQPATVALVAARRRSAGTGGDHDSPAQHRHAAAPEA